MPVDILAIAPPAQLKETVQFAGQEVAISGLRMTQIARIAQRFDGFRKAYFDDGVEANYRAAAMLEAYPAIIVAGLGKDGARDAHLIEAHVEKFAHAEQQRLARAILRLTNPEPEPEAANDNAPLEGAPVEAAEAKPAE